MTKLEVTQIRDFLDDRALDFLQAARDAYQASPPLEGAQASAEAGAEATLALSNAITSLLARMP